MRLTVLANSPRMAAPAVQFAVQFAVQTAVRIAVRIAVRADEASEPD